MLSSLSSTFLGDKPGDKSVDGGMPDCSWCERADAYGAVSWVSLGDNAGDKAVGKVLRVVEIVHL